MHTWSPSVSSGIANVPWYPERASQRVPEQVFEGHETQVRCVCFHPDENKLVSGSDDGTLRVWDRATGSAEVLSGHTDWVCDVDVSRDGELVVSASDDNTVRIWDRKLGETLHVFEGHENYVISVQFSADSRRVVSGSGDETARVWSVETGELAFEPIKCHGRVYCVSYSPDGDRIASGADSIQIWNAETGSGLLSIRNSKVVSLAWTTNGTHVIGGGRGKVTIWNSHNGEQLRTWQAHSSVATIKLSLSPSGSHLVTRGWNDKTAFVFDVSTGEQVAAIQHDEDVYGIVYSPSGQFIGTGCDDGRVYLWKAPILGGPSANLSPASSFLSFLDVCTHLSVLIIPRSLMVIIQRSTATCNSAGGTATKRRSSSRPPGLSQDFHASRSARLIVSPADPQQSRGHVLQPIRGSHSTRRAEQSPKRDTSTRRCRSGNR
ncbi:hypothetical protein PAXRUDRAFT_366041 [Paxillus rubicundulus Ve08.2h10]|uniref:WD40 repeat-like protein n=1 Tax=Paxillus rubicundulus Ve08.2h10 TaxID=930991 RepID=A0A0D0CQR9_9AGAM|nr:hypothetical protein PAXRUDRAFT_366041 [Paxillus rubicundulus Ve08.2h10]